MRPKVIFCVLLIGLVSLGIIVFISSTFHRQPGASPTKVLSPAEQSLPFERTAIKGNALSNQNHADTNIAVVTNSASPELSAKYIHDRKAEFYDLSMRADQNSLNTLLSEMKNPNKEIRKAALEAVVQFDDRSSIPRLQELAKQTTDPEEKNEILAAADYIKLPSLPEYIAERKAYKEKMGITNKSRSVFRKPPVNP